MKSLLLLAVFATLLPAAEEYTYWIADCAQGTPIHGCQAGDKELARWALEAWQRESGGALVFEKGPGEEHSQIRLHWANGTSSLYGETEPTLVDGKRGADVYVLPSVVPPGADALLRDAIVYLTCLHESGHALGLVHTRSFADIMYSFQYGGDITAYFGRYRALLKTRTDIHLHSGISDADRTALRLALKQ